jgi:putative transposase
MLFIHKKRQKSIKKSLTLVDGYRHTYQVGGDRGGSGGGLRERMVRKVLVRNHGNVSEAARVLGISRQTVRRARDGGLDDLSRRPHRSPRKTSDAFEGLVVAEGKRTGFRYRRLSSYLQRKYGLVFSEDTVRAILRRNQVKRHTRRAATGHVRHLYDYEALIPFRELQLDTKHLLDKGALAPEVYAHMNQYGLPRYEWHIMPEVAL